MISNGDIGYQGRKAGQRIAATGNNHGSIECINGKWYVFYHRQTHGTNFSRQACAEPIEIMEDGTIPQVPVSSCGLYGGVLEPVGWYPAAMACILSNGHMKAVGNPFAGRKVPFITEKDGEVYISNVHKGTRIGIRSFRFPGEKLGIRIIARGTKEGKWRVYLEEECRNCQCELCVPAGDTWREAQAEISPSQGVYSLMLVYEGSGTAELLEFCFEDKDGKAGMESGGRDL